MSASPAKDEAGDVAANEDRDRRISKALRRKSAGADEVREPLLDESSQAIESSSPARPRLHEAKREPVAIPAVRRIKESHEGTAPLRGHDGPVMEPIVNVSAVKDRRPVTSPAPAAVADGAVMPDPAPRSATRAAQLPPEPAPLVPPPILDADGDGRVTRAEKRQHERQQRELALAASRRRTARDPARPVTEMPPPPPGHREVEVSPILPDRAWTRMLYDESTHSYLYEVVEPRLEDDELEILAFLRDTLIRTLDGRRGSGQSWEEVLVKAIGQAIEDHSIQVDEVSTRRLEYFLVRDFLGYGPVDVLMRDPMIEDISCDGPLIPVYLFHRKYESVRTSVRFADDLELDSFVIRLAQRAGKHISIADPILDATLPDGSRLQATLSKEVTTRGSSFTVRKFRADPLTPPDLVRLGTFSAEMAAYFWFAMEMGHSLLLAGGTASGKTTTLNAISQFIPPAKKIVSIEDTREINLSHENWIAGVTRSGFGGEIVGGKIAGTIDMYKLLEAALRQRPEYLLVGEVRGPEALTLFQAMATGHAVYSTMHADSVQSAVYRLENPPINVPRMMLQTLDIVAIQAQVRIKDKFSRRIKEVTEVVGFDPETRELLTNTVFEWDNSSDRHRYLGKSYILEQVAESRALPEAEVEHEWRRRVEVIDWMMQKGIRHYADVARVVSGYYRNRDSVLAMVRGGGLPAAL